MASMAWRCCPSKSMLQTSRERSKAKKYLHRNLDAGQLSPNEHYLERAGLRGRKKWLCCCLFLFIFLLAVGHLAVTCLILGILEFGTSGFTYFTFSGSSTIWPRGGSLSNVTIATPNGINGYRAAPLTLSAAQGGEIRPEVNKDGRSLSHVSLTESALNFSIGETLSMRSKEGEQFLLVNESLLQVNGMSVFGLMRASQVTTHEVSGVNRINTSRRLTLRGEGGVTTRGDTINITAGRNVTLTGQRVVLAGNRGITLQIPETAASSAAHYHLCATTNGTLFLVPANPQRCLGP